MTFAEEEEAKRAATLAMKTLTDERLLELFDAQLVKEPTGLVAPGQGLVNDVAKDLGVPWYVMAKDAVPRRLRSLVDAGILQKAKGEELKQRGLWHFVILRNEQAWLFFRPGTIERLLEAKDRAEAAEDKRAKRFATAHQVIGNKVGSQFELLDGCSLEHGGDVTVSLDLFEWLAGRACR